jgi:hypothetical protein
VNEHGREKIDSTYGRAVVGLDCGDMGITVVDEASNFVCLLGPSDVFNAEHECPFDTTFKVHGTPQVANSDGIAPDAAPTPTDTPRAVPEPPAA